MEDHEVELGSRTQNVSLSGVEWHGLNLLAQQERFGNKSSVVGSLISAELNRLYGDDWREQVMRHAQATANAR